MLDDAGIWSRIRTEIHPDEPAGEAETRATWAIPRMSMVINRLLVEDEGEPVGLALNRHPATWPPGEPRYGSLDVALVPAAHDSAQYDRLLALMIDALVEAGAEALEATIREDDEFFRSGLERNGFWRDRLSKAWELDLEANHERMLADRSDARARMDGIGVELVTLAEAAPPDKQRRFYDLDIATTRDVPHTVPFVEPTFEEWMAAAARPDIRDDRIWTAWIEGELVALSFLKYPSVGNVWTGYTACHRAHRGRGIARAVKMETLGQAIELGVPRVRTDNDEQNAPMLHINETLGYYRIPGFLSYLRT